MPRYTVEAEVTLQISYEVEADDRDDALVNALDAVYTGSLVREPHTIHGCSVSDITEIEEEE